MASLSPKLKPSISGFGTSLGSPLLPPSTSDASAPVAVGLEMKDNLEMPDELEMT